MYQNLYIDSDGYESTVYLWDDVIGLSVLDYNKEFNYAYKPHPHGSYKSFTGVPLKRVKRFRKDDPDLFESDLPKETRILTDVYLDSDTPSTGHRIFYFDIEVSMEDGIPDVHDVESEITSIAYYDKITDEYEVLTLDTSGKYSNSPGVTFYQDEASLLFGFLEKWEAISPTIITGWNSDYFDIPYLYRRLLKVCGKSEANRLSPIGKVKWSSYRKKYQIAGVSSLDYIDLYKKFTYIQRPNYRLDTIAQLELGEGKVEYDGNLNELFKSDIRKFVEYNLQDVKLVVGLDDKLKLIELVRGICHVGHVPYEDYMYSSRFLEGTIVTYLHRKNLVVTNRHPDARQMMNDKDDNTEKFAGAFVKDPITGKHDWVFSLDLQSLYPSIIMSLNISPETKVGYYEDGVLRDLDGTKKPMSESEFREFIETNNFCISSNGIIYRTDKRGIIPEILENWFDQRVEYKTKMKEYIESGDTDQSEYYDRRQHIQKIFLNSLYGVLGLPIFRFFDIDNALAVTSCGQDVIKESSTFVNKFYKDKTGIETDNCIYIDTDSLYFSSTPLKDDGTTDERLEFTIKLARFFENKLNIFYDEFSKNMFNCNKHKLVIKGETVALSGIWIAKKRYALDKIYDLESDRPTKYMVVKGLDIIRSSFPDAFKGFMEKFISDVLSGVNKNNIDDYILKFHTDMLNLDFSLVARNTSVAGIKKYEFSNGSIHTFKKSTPAHVKAAIGYNRLIDYFDLNSLYQKIEDGEKIKYVYLKNNVFNLDVLAFKNYNDPPKIIEFINEYCDSDKLFEKELKGKLQDFYDVLKWGALPVDKNLIADNFFDFD